MRSRFPLAKWRNCKVHPQYFIVVWRMAFAVFPFNKNHDGHIYDFMFAAKYWSNLSSLKLDIKYNSNNTMTVFTRRQSAYFEF